MAVVVLVASAVAAAAAVAEPNGNCPGSCRPAGADAQGAPGIEPKKTGPHSSLEGCGPVAFTASCSGAAGARAQARGLARGGQGGRGPAQSRQGLRKPVRTRVRGPCQKPRTLFGGVEVRSGGRVPGFTDARSWKALRAALAPPPERIPQVPPRPDLDEGSRAVDCPGIGLLIPCWNGHLWGATAWGSPRGSLACRCAKRLECEA